MTEAGKFQWPSGIERISGHYRAAGHERLTIGYDYRTCEWVVEEFRLRDQFDPRSTCELVRTTRFQDDRDASSYLVANGYR